MPVNELVREQVHFGFAVKHRVHQTGDLTMKDFLFVTQHFLIAPDFFELADQRFRFVIADSPPLRLKFAPTCRLSPYWPSGGRPPGSLPVMLWPRSVARFRGWRFGPDDEHFQAVFPVRISFLKDARRGELTPVLFH